MRRTRRVCGPFGQGVSCVARILLTSERTTTRTRGWAAQEPSNPAMQGFSQGTWTHGAAGSCKPIKPPRAERRRFLLPWWLRSRSLAVCSPQAHGGIGLERGLCRHVPKHIVLKHLAPRARRTAQRSARLFGGNGNKTTDVSRSRNKRGTMTRVRSSTMAARHHYTGGCRQPVRGQITRR
jgi:hypothetical protein